MKWEGSEVRRGRTLSGAEGLGNWISLRDGSIGNGKEEEWTGDRRFVVIFVISYGTRYQLRYYR